MKGLLCIIAVVLGAFEITQGAPSSSKEPPEHWAFKAPVRPKVPSSSNSQFSDFNSQSANPIDAFLAVEWQKHGLTPTAAAPKEVLLRRVYLDLIGLPPTREELHAFLGDSSPDAYEKVVNRLLD